MQNLLQVLGLHVQVKVKPPQEQGNTFFFKPLACVVLQNAVLTFLTTSINNTHK